MPDARLPRLVAQWDEARRAERYFARLLREAMVSVEVTPAQVSVLFAVGQTPGAPPSQADLVHRTGIDRSTLADIVQRLCRQGLITRQRRQGDARAFDVSLTEAGWDTLEEASRRAARASETTSDED